MEPKTHKYFSIPAKYSGCPIEDLELTIQKYGNDVVRMQLTNRIHSKQCRTQLKRFLGLVGLTIVYYCGLARTFGDGSFSILQAHILYPGLICLALAFYILQTTLGLVHSEKLFYSWDMALQTETIRTFGFKSVFCVQRGHLHDIVLNEVIENLDVKYMLILRTKGSMFEKRPIIPLFNSLSPSFECLKYIQQILHGYWLNNRDKAKGQTD